MSFIEQRIASEREVCQFLGLARAALQCWKGFCLSPRKLDDQKLPPLVTKLFHQHKSRYGTRRLRGELSDLGQAVGRRRVSRFQRKAGLSAIQPRSFKPRTTDSRHRLGYSPNLILELKEVTAPNHHWVGDISYLPVLGTTEVASL